MVCPLAGPKKERFISVRLEANLTTLAKVAKHIVVVVLPTELGTRCCIPFMDNRYDMIAIILLNFSHWIC